jgi:hypothetical protein
METLQFEGVKVALKQDKTGYMLTLNVHPDEIPDQLMRDFVGARYQVVMVRLDANEKPMNREQEYSPDLVRSSAILCRDPNFWKFLVETSQAFDASEETATAWLKQELGIESRTELKTNKEAIAQYKFIFKEFQAWKQANG